MTPEKVRRAVQFIGLSTEELAHEIGVSPRSVARWQLDGVGLFQEFCLTLICRLKARGIPWRKNEIGIRLAPEGGVDMRFGDLANPIAEEPV